MKTITLAQLNEIVAANAADDNLVIKTLEIFDLSVDALRPFEHLAPNEDNFGYFLDKKNKDHSQHIIVWRESSFTDDENRIKSVFAINVVSVEELVEMMRRVHQLKYFR